MPTRARSCGRVDLGPMLQNDWGGGPRSTPTVEDGLVYALGGKGTLVCVRAKDGSEVWRTHLVDDARRHRAELGLLRVGAARRRPLAVHARRRRRRDRRARQGDRQSPLAGHRARRHGPLFVDRPRRDQRPAAVRATARKAAGRNFTGRWPSALAIGVSRPRCRDPHADRPGQQGLRHGRLRRRLLARRDRP